MEKINSVKDDENYELILTEKRETSKLTLAMPFGIAIALYQQLRSDFEDKE